MKLAKRNMYYLYRCLLAEWFTRPTVVEFKTPTPTQLTVLKVRGLLSIKGGTTRLTPAGKDVLFLAGIDTRNAKAAESSWAALKRVF